MAAKTQRKRPNTQRKRAGNGKSTDSGDTLKKELLEVKEQLRQTEMLLNISRQVSAFEKLEDVLGELVAITTRETNAERATLWLNDDQTGELYSRVAQGTNHREIRILNNSGVAGYVYQKDKGVIIHDAYSDPHFDSTIDKETGYLTKSIIAAPIKTVGGELIGVVQALNKKGGLFTKQDLHLLQAMTTQAAITLQSRMFVERMDKTRKQEMEFLDIVSDISSEIELKPLLKKVMDEVLKMLKADRATLFLNDEHTNELWASVGTGLQSTEIRFPNHLGIAGTVFIEAETVNIPYAYADLRFNPGVDKKTGYFTRSILCVPVVNKSGKTIGAAQCLNKQGGPFTAEDESRLKAFSAKISLALENAKLFADIQAMKNYNESILESMTNGVITLDEKGKIVTCNAAGLRIMHTAAKDIIEKQATDFFVEPNLWVLDKVKKVESSQEPDNSLDAELEFDGKKITVNLTVLPLVSEEQDKLGSLVMIEDISKEKRGKAALSRYLGSELADQLTESGGLKDKTIVATVLFSDIRGFTTLTEKLGATGIVTLLNEYFTVMVDCVEKEGGQLDKFIGDALMAGFGHIIEHDDDTDRAVRSAISMIKRLGDFNEQRKMQGEDPIAIGIGLNTEELVVGNIGSEKQSNYTMIGDGVNLAARLESACKQYFSRILISEHTYQDLKSTYRMRDIDWVVVKGKTKPVTVYEILDYHTEESFPNMMEALNHFKSGRDYYRAQKWDKAIDAFGEALSLNPDDKLSGMYIDRCKHMEANPPAKDWDGVWVMTSK